MQIKNKLALCSNLSVTIGIATITTSTYLRTHATAQSKNQATGRV